MNELRKTTLGKEVDFLTGFPFKSSGYVEQGIRLLRGDNIAQGTLNWSEAKQWPAAEREKFEGYELREDDVILAMDRPWISAGLKYASVSRGDIPCLLVQRTARLRGGERLDTRYLKYIIGSPQFEKYIKRITTGSLVPHISGEQIKDFEVYLPSLRAQEKIAAVLSAIDAKIYCNNQINAELEGMAKALYDYWFVQFDFPDVNGRPYSASGGVMVYDATLKRDIPLGWRVESLLNSCSVIDCLHSKKPDFLFEDEAAYLLQLENILNNGQIDISNKYFVSWADYKKWIARIEVKEHDVVMTNAGRVAAFAQIPQGVVCGIGRNITAIRPRSIQPNFFFLSLSGMDVQSQIYSNLDQGAFFKSFNVKGIKVLNLLRPEPALEFAFEKKISPFIMKRHEVASENQQLIKLRNWLLPMLMNGQVTVV